MSKHEAYDKMLYDKINSYNKDIVHLVESLASQASIALTNQLLIEEQKELFKSFIQLVAEALEKKDAVNSWRETIGATNPSDADGGTIRKLYATSLGENAVHGSDSDENAKKEIAFFFSEYELITNI